MEKYIVEKQLLQKLIDIISVANHPNKTYGEISQVINSILVLRPIEEEEVKNGG